METVLNNGGSTLTSYELLMDDGKQGELIPIYGGLERVITVRERIYSGRTYRFMFRV